MNNPCARCEKATEYRNKKYPHFVRCFPLCESRQKYDSYKEKRRKYKIGNPIHTLDELMNQKFVFWHNKVCHIEVIKCQQYNTIINGINNSSFYTAISNEDENSLLFAFTVNKLRNNDEK